MVGRLIVKVMRNVGVNSDLDDHRPVEDPLERIDHVRLEVGLEHVASELVGRCDRDCVAVDDLRDGEGDKCALLRRNIVVVGECLESFVPHLADVERVFHGG